MPRATRDTRLDTRTARAKLAIKRHPYRRAIESGLLLLYYRGKQRGSWSVRLYDVKSHKYQDHKLGVADDYRDANDGDVLNFKQAQDKARKKAEELARRGSGQVQKRRGPYTVEHAVEDYLEWFQAHRKSYRDVKARLACHVLPRFESVPVEELSIIEIERWHQGIARSPAQMRSPRRGKKNVRKNSDPRARKVTANRMLSYFKAVLNRAVKNKQVCCDPVWNDVAPFEGVETERREYLNPDEAKRLINAADEEFRPLIKAALLTGCRFSELAQLKCRDFDKERQQIFIEKSKSCRSRYIPLNAEGGAFFTKMTLGIFQNDTIFRLNGKPWQQGYNKRFDAARKQAKITKHVTFHSLRHTYASLLVNEGVPLKVISDLLGHHNTAVTERYYAHLCDSVKKRAVELYLPVFGIEEKSNVVAIGQTS